MAPDNWFYHYQTLITGVLAVLVGVVTIALLWIQIQQTKQQLQRSEDQHTRQLQRQLRAFRAGLPIALTQIHAYANQCIEIAARVLELHPEEEDSVIYPPSDAPPPIVPTYPVEAFRVLQSTIEFADIEDAAKLHRIIAYSQIQHSRLESLVNRVFHGADPDFVTTSQNVLYAVRDAVGMRMYIDAVYDYARETEPHIHELGDANRAVEATILIEAGGERARTFIKEHWPPDFPRKIAEV